MSLFVQLLLLEEVQRPGQLGIQYLQKVRFRIIWLFMYIRADYGCEIINSSQRPLKGGKKKSKNLIQLRQQMQTIRPR